MTRYLKVTVICILVTAFTVPAASELYQYTDPNGITRLTNNIYSVPPEYRSQLAPYSEIAPLTGEMEIQTLQEPQKSRIIPIAKKVQPDTDRKPGPEILKQETGPTEKITDDQSAPGPEIKPEMEKPFRSASILLENIADDQKTIPPPEPVIPAPDAALPVRQTSPVVSTPMENQAEPRPESEPGTSVPLMGKDSSGQDKKIGKKAPMDLAHLEITRKSLAGKKEALNKKYLILLKEKQEIESSVDENDEKSVLKYNENVKKLNAKIKRYKIEKNILQAEIEKYNQAIQQLTVN